MLLEGTEAIRKNPKALRFPHETGTICEFPRVETTLDGEEVVDGLTCVKILCKRWYYSNSTPVSHHLWLASARNYLCVRSETINGSTKRVSESSRIEELREIAPDIWLPSKVVSVDGAFDSDGTARQLPEWKDTLVLKKAAIDPGRPVSFFRDVTIPSDLPSHTIENGRLTDSHFQDREPPADAPQKLIGIVDEIRRYERESAAFEVELEKTYHKFGEGISGPTGLEYMQTKSLQRSIAHVKSLWYSEQANSTMADSSPSKSERIEAYDGAWARGSDAHHHTKGGTVASVVQATVHRNDPKAVPVHWFHMLFFRDDGNYGRLSDFLTSGWIDRHNGYRLSVSYLGEEIRDGLNCAVLRLNSIIDNVPVPQRNFRLVWLARDRNLLPVRYEWHQPAACEGLPTGIGTVKELRELRPGVWCPFRVEFLAYNGADCTGLCTGRMVINHRTEYAIRRVSLEPTIAPGEFDGPTILSKTTVWVANEAGRIIGSYEQPEDGRISISDKTYLEMLNADNLKEGKSKERIAALDALIGKTAPEFPNTDWINCPPHTWKDYTGKVVVVNFWAHWCGPSGADLKSLSELHRKWHDAGKSDVVIVGVHTAGSQPEAIDEAVKAQKLGYPICIDSPLHDGVEGWGTLCKQFAVRAIPETFVIGKDGKVAAHGRLEEMLIKAPQLAK